MTKAGHWQTSPLVGKEWELEQEVQKHQLDIVGLTTLRAKALEANACIGVELSGVGQGERSEAGVGITNLSDSTPLFRGLAQWMGR